jgi:dihydroneopterin aldolase / 2-amino-4-hydroxy-6-hydroxymethyldihydropteridine diphosphokinase
MSDLVRLTGLRVRGRHGVLAAETELGQEFVVDVALSLDTRPAAAADDVALTVHYGELAERLAAVVAGEPVQLLETLAERLAAVCLAAGPVERVEVVVHKPSAPIAVPFGDVSVTAVTAVTAVLSLGSNVGDRAAHLRAALDLLAPVAVSPVYETDPVGGPAQGAYLNLVAVCDLDATAAWDLAQQAEEAAGRVRDVRWGPRTLDVDVVAADGPVPAGLEVPHPRAGERAFVLVPWLDVDPVAVLPGAGPVADLVAALDTSGVRRWSP